MKEDYPNRKPLRMRGYDYSPMTLKGYIGCAIMFVGILLTQFTFGKKALVDEK